ncbi:MAG: flap structure-specific endonuclease [Promethearchaeota archaeon CR_4]|nr:MAG: flap structure-specific endonuclease [Candidatus Lokiarchaeota archaeon CR_4]
MGSNISPLIVPFQKPSKLPKGEVVVIDGHNAVVQAMTKSVAGWQMGAWRDRHGKPVAHLYGILNRATGILQVGAWPLFVFDGKPADEKGKKDFDRIQAYITTQTNLTKAQRGGDIEYASWLRERPAYFWPKVFAEVKQLLGFLGCPYLQATSEGEAQAAFLCMIDAASAVISQDFDTMLFGAPLLLRRIQGPKAAYVEVRLSTILRHLHLTREQLVDVAILAGTDFHPGIAGLGSKLALKLVQQYGWIEDIPPEIKASYDFSGLPLAQIDVIRSLFLAPDIRVDVPAPVWRFPARESLVHLCCREHHLNEDRILRAAERWVKALKQMPKVVQSRLFS